MCIDSVAHNIPCSHSVIISLYLINSLTIKGHSYDSHMTFTKVRCRLTLCPQTQIFFSGKENLGKELTNKVS